MGMAVAQTLDDERQMRQMKDQVRTCLDHDRPRLCHRRCSMQVAGPSLGVALRSR